jgi:magnesium-transporting ATPase (P-type)
MTVWKHKFQGSASAYFATLECSQIDASLQGLSSSEALSRRRIVGSNELLVNEQESLISKFLEQFKNPMILLLFGSALLSVFMGVTREI